MDRERADVADLERHLAEDRTWSDNRVLPPHPNVGIKSASRSFHDVQEQARAQVVAESRRLRQPGGFRRGHLDANAEAEGVPIERRTTFRIPSLMQHLEASGLFFHMSGSIYEQQYGRDDSFYRCDEHASTPHKLSKMGLIMFIIKANIGASVLFQASGWKSGGYIVTTCFVPVIGSIAVFCGLRLLKVRKTFEGRCSYGELMFQACGRPGLVAINTSIFLLQTGGCCSYIALIAKTVQQSLIPQVRLELMIVGTGLLFIPFSLVRQISKFAPFCVYGVLATCVAIGFVLVCVFQRLPVDSKQWGELVPVKLDGVLVALGTVLFTFEGIATLLPIYDATADQESFPLTYVIIMSGIAILNGTLGLAGYLAFGEQTAAFILLNLPETMVLKIVKLAYLTAIVCTFPLALFPAIRVVEDAIFGLPTSDPPFCKKCKKNFGRALLVTILSLVTVAASSSLEHFVSVVGAFCGTPLILVYPAIVHMRLYPEPRFFNRVVDWAIVVIGTLLTLGITVNAFMTWGQT